MRRLAAALLIFVAGAAAQAQNEADPVAFVQAIYRDYQRDKPTAWPDRAYSPRLQKLIDDDRKNTPAGEVGRLDFDPFVAGQDWKIEGLSVTLVSRDGDNAVVEARFKNLGSPVDLRYSLVRGGGRWLIDDLENLVKPRWTMSKILAGPPTPSPMTRNQNEFAFPSIASKGVVPAQAGTHAAVREKAAKWVPAFAGTTKVLAAGDGAR